MRWVCSIFIACLIKGAFAANSITPGTLNLNSTFECIAVVASFSGDDNSNATAVVQFKKTSDSNWLNAYMPWIDRRATVTSANDNVSNQNQARVSIVGVSANTSYDVRVLWSDADGGSGNVTNTVSTLAYSIPNAGADIWVDAAQGSEGDGSSGNPYKTITNAIAHATAGNKLRVKNGTYVAFTMSTSGASGNYLRIVGEPNSVAVIDGTGLNQNLTCGAGLSWVSFENLLFNQSEHLTTTLANGQHHLWFSGCVFTNVSRIGSSGLDAAIMVQSGTVSNVFILNSSFYTTNNQDSVEGVWLNVLGNTFVVSSNLFCGQSGGGFRDSVSGGSGAGTNMFSYGNVDICHNVFTNYFDDGIEMDGPGNNLRVWDNSFYNVSGFSGVSIAPLTVGPGYFFRNRILVTTSTGHAFKNGNGEFGAFYVFHNTVVITNGNHDAIGESGGTPRSVNGIYLNNILEASRYTLYQQGRNNSYDYNLHYQTVSPGPGFIIDEYDVTNNYATFAAFKAGQPTQEVHGINANPLLSGFLLATNSPALNAGIIIPNFNDPASAWPYNGVAPDIGAVEFVSPIQNNSVRAFVGKMVKAP